MRQLNSLVFLAALRKSTACQIANGRTDLEEATQQSQLLLWLLPKTVPVCARLLAIRGLVEFQMTLQTFPLRPERKDFPLVA